MAEDMPATGPGGAGAGPAGAGAGPGRESGETGGTGGTGDARVDEAIAPLDQVADVPLEEHPAIFERIHDRLREVLGELNPGVPGPSGPPGPGRPADPGRPSGPPGTPGSAGAP